VEWSQTGETGEFTVTRVLNAPRELVFEVFFDPEQFVQFWGPAGTHTPIESVVIEAWAGGRFKNTMVADDGSGEFPMQATFVEVVAPERFTFEVTDGIVSTSTFTDLGDGRTEMTIHQRNVPMAFLTPENQAGFVTSIDRFESYLELVRR
jgi:uncharacterized protein YndB with AHSA1/START domain